MVVVSKSEFKGNQILELKRNEFDERPFRFGLNKSKLILLCIDDIRKFVLEHDKDWDEK